MHSPKLKMLAPFQCQLLPSFASGAFESQDNLLGSFGFFVEDWFRLTSVTGLLAIITTFPLGKW